MPERYNLDPKNESGPLKECGPIGCGHYCKYITAEGNKCQCGKRSIRIPGGRRNERCRCDGCVN